MITHANSNCLSVSHYFLCRELFFPFQLELVRSFCMGNTCCGFKFQHAWSSNIYYRAILEANSIAEVSRVISQLALLSQFEDKCVSMAYYIFFESPDALHSYHEGVAEQVSEHGVLYCWFLVWRTIYTPIMWEDGL